MPPPRTPLRRLFSHFEWVIIAFFGIFCLWGLYVSGPFWYGPNGDVNYVYLLSGLDYLNFHPSGINDQPAIIVKLVNAAIVVLLFSFRWAAGRADDMPSDVIQHSELYLHAISLTVFVGVLVVLFFFLKSLKYSVKNTYFFPLAAASFLLSSSVLHHIFLNKPEPYLVILGLWLGRMVVHRFSQEKVASIGEATSFILLALLSKVTILPFLLLAVYVVGVRRFVMRVLPVTLLCLLPILFLFWVELKETAVWVFRVVIRQEAQGHGSIGLYATEEFGKNLFKFFRINKGLVVLFVLALLSLFSNRSQWKPKAIFLLSYTLFFVFVIKQPNTHYFVVAYALLPSFVLVQFSTFRWHGLHRTVPFFLLLFLILRGASYAKGVVQKKTHWDLYHRKPGVEAYYTSSKPFALFMANSIQSFRHNALLYSIYPSDTFYHVDHRFYTFNGPIPMGELEGKQYTVRSSCRLVEEAPQLQIVSRQRFDYVVKVKGEKE